MINILPSIASMASQRLQQAYDSLWKAFEQQRQMSAGVSTREVLNFLNQIPEVKDRLSEPTLAGISTLVSLGALSVPQAVDMAIKLQNANLQRQILLQNFKTSQALQQKTELEMQLAQARDKREAEQLMMSLYVAKHDQIDKYFDHLMGTYKALIQNRQSLETGKAQRYLEDFPLLIKYLETIRDNAHKVLDNQTIKVKRNGQQVDLPMSPYGAVTEAFQTVPANLTMKQWQGLGDIFNIQLGEIASAYKRGGADAVKQYKLDQLTLPNILRVFTKVQESQSESKVLSDIQNLVDQANKLAQEQEAEQYNKEVQKYYPSVNATAIGESIFANVGTSNATNATQPVANATNATQDTFDIGDFD